MTLPYLGSKADHWLYGRLRPLGDGLNGERNATVENAMEPGEHQLWRTEEVTDDGAVFVRDVEVACRQSPHDGWWGPCVKMPNGNWRGTRATTPRDAVVEVACSERWHLLGVLAPGQKTRRELVDEAANHKPVDGQPDVAPGLYVLAAALCVAVASALGIAGEEAPAMDAFGRRRREDGAKPTTRCPACDEPVLLIIAPFQPAEGDPPPMPAWVDAGDVCEVCQRRKPRDA